jgi:hypothetical protein
VGNGGTAPEMFILSAEWFVVILLGAHRTEISACLDKTFTTTEKLQGVVQAQCLYRRKAMAVHNITYYIYIYIVALQPNAGHGLLILEVSISHTATHHRR